MFKRDLKYEKVFWEEKDENFVKLEIKNLQRMQKFIQAWIERFWKIPENPLILEIGGAGRPVINFFKSEKKYALDPLIDFYEKKFPELYNDPTLYKIKTEAEEIPLNDNTFDLIIMLNVLDHTEHPNRVIRECHRILKNEGIMVLSVDTFNLFWKILRRFLPFLGFKYYYLHPQTLRVEDVKKILRRNNFQTLDLFTTEKIKIDQPSSLKEKLKFYLKYNFYRTYILVKRMKTKVILITNIPSPYRIPVWNYISQQGDFDFKIFFMKETEHNREWQIPLKEIKFKYEILSGLYLPIKKLNWQIHFNPGIFFKLKKENPDIVILDGYDTPTIWLALLFAKLNKKKIISWIGSSLAYSKNTKGIIGLLKKIFIKSSNAFIAYGKLAKEYLEFFGAESDKIFVGCNVGDVNFFREKVYSFRKTKKFLKERKKYPPVLFLFVGRLVREKGVLEMLNALKDIEEKNWGLIIVGDGPLFSEIKNFCQANNLDQKIQLVGFKQKDELIRYYALADIFLFPSLREPYGIVLSEALASGLFALASKYAGATPDLLREKENGFVIDPKDINDLKTKIEFVIKRFSENPWQREDISDSVQKFTPEYYGQKIIKAIISTL